MGSFFSFSSPPMPFKLTRCNHSTQTNTILYNNNTHTHRALALSLTHTEGSHTHNTEITHTGLSHTHTHRSHTERSPSLSHTVTRIYIYTHSQTHTTLAHTHTHSHKHKRVASTNQRTATAQFNDRVTMIRTDETASGARLLALLLAVLLQYSDLLHSGQHLFSLVVFDQLSEVVKPTRATKIQNRHVLIMSCV